MTIDSDQQAHTIEIDANQKQRVASRVHELSKHDPQFGAAVPLREVTDSARTPGLRLTRVLETLVNGYADRPALGQCIQQDASGPATAHVLEPFPPFATMTYRQVWDRVQAIATAWHHDPECPIVAGEVVATIGFSCADYVVVDMVCAYLGLVSVPLQHNAEASRLRPIVEECDPTIIAVSAECLELAVELALTSRSLRQLMVFGYRAGVEEQCQLVERARTRLHHTKAPIGITTIDETVEQGRLLASVPAYTDGTDQRLAMILYTSGSTGTPKGAMYTEAMLCKAWTPGPAMPTGAAVINVNFMPLNHLGGRMPLASALINGGTSYFAAKSDLSTLFDDFASVRPTELVLVPRVAEILFHRYRSAVDHKIAQGVDPEGAQTYAAAELRQSLGGRVLGGLVGSAPVSGQLKTFLHSALDVHIIEGYASTETGMISLDGVVNRSRVLDYKLVDVPELGYFLTDRPYPRGELLVKTTALTAGYYKRPDITAAVFDEDGFYRTGDVMAELEQDRLAFVDRRNNVLKLTHGEFVAVTSLEAIYAAAPLVRQIYVYGSSEQSGLLAVIVPTALALAEFGNSPLLKSALRQSLQHTAAAAQLQSYELPVDFLVETEPFCEDNGLLSGIGKQLRPRLLERYGGRLDQLYTDIAAAQVEEVRALHHSAVDRPVIETLTRASRSLVHATTAGPAAHFTDLGGDSLSALTLSDTLREIYQIDVPVNVILGPGNTLADVADYIEIQRSSGALRPSATTVHAGPNIASAAELTLDRFIDTQILSRATKSPLAIDTPHVVLLTGANGWLGRFLTLEWLETLCERGGKLITIVRGRDATDARNRLEQVFNSGDHRLLDRFQELAPAHLEVLPGDIGEPALGLDDSAWKRLARSIDLIVHPAALVNHLLPYGQLFAPNVAGTAEIIRLAITSRITPISYLSTAAVAMGVPSGRFPEDGDIRQISPTRVINDAYANGYANSKWAGEVLLREAHDLCGVPVTVFRSDMILAHRSYRGQLNLTDIFTRLIFSLIVTGIAPQSFYKTDSDGNRMRAHYDGLPVDFIGEAITTISTQATDGYRSFDVMNPHDDGVSLDVCVDWLIDAGNTIERIDNYQEWLVRFRTALTGLPEHQRRQSVLPLLHAFAEPETPTLGATMPTAAFRHQVRTANIGSDNDIPHITADLISKYDNDLRQLGLLG